MFEKQILKAIANRLFVQGDCPEDPLCPFASGDTCFAPPDVLEQRLSKIKTTMQQEIYKEMSEGKINGGMVICAFLEPSPFPCCNFTKLIITDPED